MLHSFTHVVFFPCPPFFCVVLADVEAVKWHRDLCTIALPQEGKFLME